MPGLHRGKYRWTAEMPGFTPRNGRVSVYNFAPALNVELEATSREFVGYM